MDANQRRVARIRRIATATATRFQEQAVAAKGIAHTTAALPSLAQAVALPHDGCGKVGGGWRISLEQVWCRR